MGVFEQFPYTNMQNANMDWVLTIIKKIENDIDSDFSQYIEEWVEQNYNRLFFNAAYYPDTETIAFAKGGAD